MPQLRRLLALALVLAAFAAPMSPPDVSLAADSPGQIAVVFTDEQTPLEVAEFAQRHSLELRVVPEEPTRVASFLAPNIDSALAAVRRDTNVLAADIDEVATLATNDPLYDDMWWLRNVGQSFTIGLIVKVISAIYGTFTSATLPAESGNDIAWEQARSLPACNGVPCTGAGVLVGVVDTGIDASHPDLAGGVVTAGSRSYIPGYGPLDDDNGHGTFIAGLIAATANNGIGMTGVAPDASLLPMKAADVTGDSLVSDSSSAIIAAAEAGATVINLSFGLSAPSVVLEAAINSVVGAPYFAIVVAAAGNDGDSVKNYPASFLHVTSVGSTDSFGNVSSFSQRNDAIDVVAPGESVFSTLANTALGQVDCSGRIVYETPSSTVYYESAYDCLLQDGVRGDAFYESSNGTSFSAPLVAGAAALAKQKWPGLTSDGFEALVRATADDDADSDGYDIFYGAGVLNIERLLSFNFPPYLASDAVGLSSPVVTNSGAETVLVGAWVDNPEGDSDITSVVVDCSPLGLSSAIPLTAVGDLGYVSAPITIPSSASVGTHTLVVTATDAAGAHTSAPVTLDVVAAGTPVPTPTAIPSFPGVPLMPVVDTSMDVSLSITSPESKFTTRKKTVTIEGTMGAAVTAVEVEGDPADLDMSARTWTARVSLKEEKNRIDATAFDVTRTVEASESVTVRLDRTEPGPVKNLRAVTTGGKTTLRWDSPDDDDIAGYHIFSEVRGKRKEVGTSRKPTDTVTGTGPFIVIAEDDAGNQGSFTDAPRTGSAGTGATFGDMAKGHFAYDAVHALRERGIIQANPRFRPNDYITRAEFAKLLILARREKPSAITAGTFADVPPNHPLASFVGPLVRLGWATGQGGAFFPDRPISRMEAARMLAKAANLRAVAKPVFADIVDSREREIAASLASAGIMVGQSGNFMPTRLLTRAEAAKMVNAVLK